MESTPQGPEDARNIADEYPSPERAPITLEDELVLPSNDGLETTATNDVSMTQQEDHAVLHGETDMQTELANQVAAQAIEAAASAAAAVAGTTAATTSPMGQGTATGVPTGLVTPTPQSTIQPQGQARQSLSHPQTLHHPRQPTFPRPRPSAVAPSSSSSPAVAGPSRTRVQMEPNEQIAILREAYARNPNPGKKELEALEEKTGRPWNRIREYFRQRRNKLRGLDDLETMAEPGRASGWLQVTYRASNPNNHVTQLSMYNGYRSRFDPFSAQTPLLGGQELIQLACATFPGCEMARDDGEYVLKGLGEKDKEVQIEEAEAWEKGMEGLVEPLRAGSWLLSSFQHQSDPSAPSTLTQTDLYTSYAARFSSLLTGTPTPEQDTTTAAEGQGDTSFSQADLVPETNEADTAGSGEMDTPTLLDDDHRSPGDISLIPNGDSSDSPIQKRENRLLNPVELINLARMTFPKCSPEIDAHGRFIIRGLERREGLIPFEKTRVGEMYPFTLMSEKKPGEAFVGLMKRKLAALAPEPEPEAEADAEGEGGNGEEGKVTKKKAKKGTEDGAEADELDEEDLELIAGLKRFKGSRLGQEVRDACISQ